MRDFDVPPVFLEWKKLRMRKITCVNNWKEIDQQYSSTIWKILDRTVVHFPPGLGSHNCMALMCGTSVKSHHDFTTFSKRKNVKQQNMTWKQWNEADDAHDKLQAPTLLLETHLRNFKIHHNICSKKLVDRKLIETCMIIMFRIVYSTLHPSVCSLLCQDSEWSFRMLRKRYKQ